MKKAIAVFSIALMISFFTLAYLSNAKDRQDQLAAALKVELTAIKDWQSRGGIKRQLAMGTSGTDVRLLQEALIADTSLDTKPTATGYYGDITRKSVMAFQEKNNIPQTGIVGDLTREKINELYFNEACPSTSFSYMDLSLSRVDKTSTLSTDYIPSDLINITNLVRTNGIACLKRVAAGYLINMFNAAAQEGVYLGVSSSFRRAEIQQLLYAFWLNTDYYYNLDKVAAPGHSEHQLGTAVDLTGASIGYNGVDEGFGNTKEGKWLAANAYKYGYIMSYPENKKSTTGYDYEPWHFRFVGLGIARDITEKGITLTELFNEGSSDLGIWRLSLQ